MSGAFLFVYEVNITIVILLVNTVVIKNIILIIFYALIDKRKPTQGGLDGKIQN